MFCVYRHFPKITAPQLEEFFIQSDITKDKIRKRRAILKDLQLNGWQDTDNYTLIALYNTHGKTFEEIQQADFPNYTVRELELQFWKLTDPVVSRKKKNGEEPVHQGEKRKREGEHEEEDYDALDDHSEEEDTEEGDHEDEYDEDYAS